MILFFLYLTVSAAFATIIHGYIYPDNRKISNPNCCKPDKLQQFFCTLFTKSPFIKTEKRTEKFRLSKTKSKSAFLRKLVLYGFVYDVDYSHIREMNAQLGKIGGNLNQIAKRVNTTNTIYKKDMEDIKELMDQIWQLQKFMVSKQPLIKQ